MSLKNLKRKSSIGSVIRTTESPTNNSQWANISREVNNFCVRGSVTGVIYLEGSEDKIEIIGQAHNINELFKSTVNSMSEVVLSHIDGYSKSDEEFAKGRLINLANHILKASWQNAKGDYDIAKKYCDSSVFLIKEMANSVSATIEKEPYVDLPEKISEYLTKASTLVPCIESIIEIRAIRDEEIREAILGKETVESLTLKIVNDTTRSATQEVDNILANSGATAESVGNTRYEILKKQVLGQVKTHYGSAMKKELEAMKESGQYEPIYDKVKSTVEFFLPIIFSQPEKESEQSMNKEVIKGQEAQPQEQEAVEVDREAVDVQTETDTQKEVEVTKEPVRKEVEVSSKEEVKGEASKKQEIPSYTEDEVRNMKTPDRFKTLAMARRGEVIILKPGDSIQEISKEGGMSQ